MICRIQKISLLLLIAFLALGTYMSKQEMANQAADSMLANSKSESTVSLSVIAE